MTPVTGTFNATGQSESWAPKTGGGRNESPAVVSLKFSSTGSVQAERYTAKTGWVISGGPWTSTGCYPLQEYVQGVQSRLNCTAVSGTVDYDVSAA